ncbi:MAG TPA: hypothetical protein VJA40_03040, partial [archaeon]|nr:hypothetical protein [archaeon]
MAGLISPVVPYQATLLFVAFLVFIYANFKSINKFVGLYPRTFDFQFTLILLILFFEFLFLTVTEYFGVQDVFAQTLESAFFFLTSLAIAALALYRLRSAD